MKSHIVCACVCKIEISVLFQKLTVQYGDSIIGGITVPEMRCVYFRVVRRLVTLISRLAQVQADFEAAQKQAESASAAARQFMEDKDNKVIENCWCRRSIQVCSVADHL